MGRLAVRAPSGDIIAVDGHERSAFWMHSAIDMSGRPSSGAIISVQTAPGRQRDNAIALLDATVRFSHLHSGGTIEVLDGRHPLTGEAMTVGGWVGPWNVAYGFFYGDDARTAAVLAYMSSIDYTDTPEGVVASSPGGGATVRCRTVIGFADGVRMLLTPIGESSVSPRGMGRQIPVGELWRNDDNPEPGRPRVDSLYVESATLAAVVFPSDEVPLIDLTQRMEALTELSGRAA